MLHITAIVPHAIRNVGSRTVASIEQQADGKQDTGLQCKCVHLTLAVNLRRSLPRFVAVIQPDEDKNEIEHMLAQRNHCAWSDDWHRTELESEYLLGVRNTLVSSCGRVDGPLGASSACPSELT